MPGFLENKEAIMKYTGFRERLLDECIKVHGFPHFRVGRNLCSHQEAIDEWAVTMAKGGIRVEEAALASG